MRSACSVTLRSGDDRTIAGIATAEMIVITASTTSTSSKVKAALLRTLLIVPVTDIGIIAFTTGFTVCTERVKVKLPVLSRA